MRAYLDSNIVIYYITLPPAFGSRAQSHLAALQSSGNVFVASDLTRLECRATWLAAGDGGVLAEFDRFFSTSVSEIVPLTTPVCDRASLIRGVHRFKTPDCLHLAAAVESGCDLFVTNDRRLSRFPDLRMDLLP